MYKTFDSDASEGRDRWQGFGIRAGQAKRAGRAGRAGNQSTVNRESINIQQPTVNSQQSTTNRFPNPVFGDSPNPPKTRMIYFRLPPSVFRLEP